MAITHEEMALAAACYALPDRAKQSFFMSSLPAVSYLWPWDRKWWKPTPDNRIRELEKAGALIAAEIDRLLRLDNKNVGDTEKCLTKNR